MISWRVIEVQIGVDSSDDGQSSRLGEPGAEATRRPSADPSDRVGRAGPSGLRRRRGARAARQGGVPATQGARDREACRSPEEAVPSADVVAPASPGATLSAAAPSPPPGGYTAVDAGVSEFKTLDGGTRVFKFTELDIEGRLKSPQLVYFLRRVRAEFAAGDLGHRSFMREMSETRKESSF